MSSDPSSSPAAPSRNQKSIGLIGVGLVGNAIADRLITAGYSVHGFDFSEERLHAFVQLGGAAMETPSAVAQVASRVIVTTSEGYDVEEVLWGDRGLVSPMHRPTHIIDTATNDPDRVSRIADRVDRDKIEFIDATIAGTSDLIRKGKCVLMVGGGGAGVTACTDLFEAIGKRWFHLGGPGTASRARLALSLLVGMHRLALAESLTFAEALGLDPQAFVEFLRASPAYSAAADSKSAKMLSGDYTAQGRMRIYLNDVRMALRFARRSGQGLPFAELQAWLLGDAVANGEGDLDTAAIIETIRRQRTSNARAAVGEIGVGGQLDKVVEGTTA